ncbi:hypothetical protein [Variovorax sp. UC122_21]|uniref:hypothetical protein n=1 Tax=Variovorax sp. UC122_21 TaxID=3374554 RepID=UPI0037567CE4
MQSACDKLKRYLFWLARGIARSSFSKETFSDVEFVDDETRLQARRPRLCT